MGEALALGAALCYGITHFFNGLLARRASGIAVAVFAQAGGTLLIVALAFTFPAGVATGPALVWGALSGVGAGLGMAALYRGMARGRMSIVVPVSDVNAAVLPVLVGIALFGGRPSLLALVGIGVAVPAIWLVSRSSQTDAEPQTPHRPQQATGVATMPRPPGQRHTHVAAATCQGHCSSGVGGSRGHSRYSAVPVRHPQQLLAIASVLAALYPVIPVLLALIFLRERVTTTQVVGLTCAAAAISITTLQ